MAWNGSGTYSRTNGVNTGSEVWQDDAAAATKIKADRHDVHDEDIATAINACLTQNNESKPTAHFLPNADDTYNLGSGSYQWGDAYVTGLYLGGTDTKIGTSNVKLNTKVIEIGVWNMDSTTAAGVAHGLTLSKIRNVSVMLRDDDGDLIVFGGDNSAGTGSSYITIGSTECTLSRRESGLYDSDLFDAILEDDEVTDFNRGWITVQYTD